MGVEGYGLLLVGGESCGTVRHEEGWMIPAVTDDCWLESRGTGDLICLQAIPRVASGLFARARVVLQLITG